MTRWAWPNQLPNDTLVERKAKLTPTHPRGPVITVGFKCLQWAIDTIPIGHSPALNCSYTQFQTWIAGAPGSSIEFYKSVLTLSANPEHAANWIRLFMVPGMGHCLVERAPTSLTRSASSSSGSSMAKLQRR